MILKNLFIVGALGMMAMGGAKATLYQTSVPTGNGAKVELVNWCSRHPYRCHGYEGHPYHWYHRDYRDGAYHCRFHPYSSWRCERFCALNPGVCFR